MAALGFDGQVATCTTWLDPQLVAPVVPADSMGELPPLARHFA